MTIEGKDASGNKAWIMFSKNSSGKIEFTCSDTEMIFTVKQAKEIAEKLRKCATEG